MGASSDGGGEVNSANEPHVQCGCARLQGAFAAPRCGAKRRNGGMCQGPAMPNGRCRFHGGLSTGPRTEAGLDRSRRSAWKHGHFSAEAKAERREARAARISTADLLRQLRAFGL